MSMSASSTVAARSSDDSPATTLVDEHAEKREKDIERLRKRDARSAEEAVQDDGPTEKQATDDFVTWSGEDDPASPLNWPAGRRWGVILSVSLAAVAVTVCSSLAPSTYPGMEERFNASRIVCTLSLSLFVAGLGIGPVFASPMSEQYGRRPIYLVSFTAFLLLNIPVAVGQNIETVLVGRFLTGLAGAAFLSVAGGSVADCFPSAKISTPMAIFTLSTFLGCVHRLA